MALNLTALEKKKPTSTGNLNLSAFERRSSRAPVSSKLNLTAFGGSKPVAPAPEKKKTLAGLLYNPAVLNTKLDLPPAKPKTLKEKGSDALNSIKNAGSSVRRFLFPKKEEILEDIQNERQQSVAPTPELYKEIDTRGGGFTPNALNPNTTMDQYMKSPGVGLPDFAGLTKNIATKVFSRIAKLTKESDIAKEVDKLLPDFTKNPSREALIKTLKNEDNPDNVQKIIDGIVNAQGKPARSASDLQTEFGSPKISGDDKTVELKAFEKLSTDGKEKLIDDYIKANDNVVSTDRAKSLFPEYEADRTLSDAVQSPARIVSEAVYDQLLVKNKGKGNNVVRIYGGGTGSGKSIAIREGEKDSAVIFEANFNTPQSAINRIEKALKQGYKVDLQYVYRDPKEAFANGVLNRKRAVTIDSHVNTHVGIPDTAIELVKKYAKNPNVEISVLDNSLGKGNAQLVENVVDFFENKRYNTGYGEKLKRQLAEELEIARKSGRISENTFTRSKGSSAEVSRQPQPERTRRIGNRINTKLEERASSARTFAEFARGTGITPEALEATARKKGYSSAREFYERMKRLGRPAGKLPDTPNLLQRLSNETLQGPATDLLRDQFPNISEKTLALFGKRIAKLKRTGDIEGHLKTLTDLSNDLESRTLGGTSVKNALKRDTPIEGETPFNDSTLNLLRVRCRHIAESLRFPCFLF